MKNALLVSGMIVLLLAPVVPVAAHDATTRSSCCRRPTRWAARHDTHQARLAITTEDQDVVLLLTGDVVAVQLSDHTFHKIRRKLRDKENEDLDNALAQAIRTAVLSGVRALLDHSAECPIRDLSDVDYQDGRLVFTTESGRRVFEDIEVSDRNVMRSFSESDARAFVREFRSAKARLD